MVRGRAFTRDDRAGALAVAIISEDVAARTWPGASPIGRRVKIGGMDSTEPGGRSSASPRRFATGSWRRRVRRSTCRRRSSSTPPNGWRFAPSVPPARSRRHSRPGGGDRSRRTRRARRDVQRDRRRVVGRAPLSRHRVGRVRDGGGPAGRRSASTRSWRRRYVNASARLRSASPSAPRRGRIGRTGGGRGRRGSRSSAPRSVSGARCWLETARGGRWPVRGVDARTRLCRRRASGVAAWPRTGRCGAPPALIPRSRCASRATTPESLARLLPF